MPDLLVVIPARGGSKRLLHKNILPLHGLPMFLHAAYRARRLVDSLDLSPDRVVVSTDSLAILSIARAHGFAVHAREQVTDTQTVPEVAAQVAHKLDHHGPVLAIQPTIWPTPTLSRLQDMLTSSVPIVGAMTRQGHIQWREGKRDLYGSHPELGIYFWPNGNVGSPPQDYMVFPECHIDIDYEADYREAQRTPQLRSICFTAAEPTTWTGTGHHRRMETLRMSLQAYPETENPGMDDIHVLDMGDTYGSKTTFLRISFEDNGPGAAHSDLVVNALLEPTGADNERTGGKWAVLRPEFLGLKHSPTIEPHRVMLLFGGTDAKNLTDRVAEIVRSVNMRPVFVEHTEQVAETMMASDILISGAGQIVHEAAHLGIPNIVLAATQREARHGHLGHRFGNIFLGLAAEVPDSTIATTLKQVADDENLREEMASRSRLQVDGRGVERIVHAIDGLVAGL